MAYKSAAQQGVPLRVFGFIQPAAYHDAKKSFWRWNCDPILGRWDGLGYRVTEVLWSLAYAIPAAMTDAK